MPADHPRRQAAAPWFARRRRKPRRSAPAAPSRMERIEPRILLTVPGTFTAAYFNNADLTDPVTTLPVSNINFDWGKSFPAPGVDPSTFSARWTGYIRPQFTQTYTFYSTADDGVRLKVNGNTLIDRWTSQPTLPGDANNDGIVNFSDFQLIEQQFGTKSAQCDFDHNGTVNTADLKIFNDHYGKTLTAVSTVDSASIALVGGQTYPITMDYFQNANLANVKLEWQSASQPRQLVPAAPAGSATTQGSGGQTIILGDGNGLYATYFDNADLTGNQVSRIDPVVQFDWQGGRPQPRIDSSTFSVRWEGQVLIPAAGDYTFLVNSDDGARLWVNDQLQIDVWGDKTESEYPSDPIHLDAGQRCDIRLEYYQNQGDAVAELKWEGPVNYGIIPTSQLYPTLTPIQPQPPRENTASLRISDDGRYLVQRDGTPFFWLADTAWALFNKTTRLDVDTYLQDRAAKEFTLTQAVLYNPGTYPTNAYHQPVFINNDPYSPNPVYFQHVDYAIQKAQELGMYVQVLPTWGDAVAAGDSRRIFNTSNAYTYGLWLGGHYADQPNIIWSLGGDWSANTSSIQDVWRALAAGLQAGDGGSHLITFHPVGGHSSTEYFTAADTWLAFNEVQSGHTRDSASYNLLTTAYNASPKPVVDAEPNYEDIPNGLNPANPPLDDYDVRKKTYWALFAGAFGAAYGNFEIYQFYTGNAPGMLNWQDALNQPGAGEMRFARELMQSRPYTGRVPDQSLIVGSTLGGSDHLQSTRGGDRSYALIYSASGKSFTVNLSKLSGDVLNAAWFNPRDGTVESIGQYGNSGSSAFTPPSSGYGNDWVLMLDDAAKNYPAPGPIVIDTTHGSAGGSITGSVSDGTATIPYRLFEPSGVPAGEKIPLILYLHGMGDRGTDNLQQTTWMGGILDNTQSGGHAAYVLAPQIDTSMWFQSYSSTPTQAMKLTIKALDEVIATQNVDPSRIYVTGVSMGGMGAWDILRWRPNTFAAAVPMSGGADPRTAAAIKDIPVWAFHGANDTIVPVSATRNMIQALRDAGGNPKYTEVAGGGHVIWNPIYEDAGHSLYTWLFAQRRPAAAPIPAAPPPKPAPIFSNKRLAPRRKTGVWTAFDESLAHPR